MRIISEFKKEYRWLSNFVEVEVELEGVKYKSVEHAYQAAKSTDPEWRKFCASDVTSKQVKRASKSIVIRADWEDIKVEVMKKLLEQKYATEKYKELLLSTGWKYIIEGNRWGDLFWGVDIGSGQGKNVLGHLIMQIRESLMNESI